MAAPTLTSISPATGPTAGGTVVTLVGTGLDTATAVDFGATPASDFSALSAVLLVAVAPAGTGTAAVTVTNPDGESNALAYQYADGLFTVAEARAFDKGQLEDTADYPAASITAKEAEIREWLERVCGVNFVPTLHTSEVHDGDGSSTLRLDWPRISSVTAISVDGTAFTADELSTTDYSSGLAIDPVRAVLKRRAGVFAAGWANVAVTYVAGYPSIPDLVKRAALLICSYELPATNLSPAAESYDIDGMSVTFSRGDGFNGQWHKLPDVMRAIRMYDNRARVF